MAAYEQTSPVLIELKTDIEALAQIDDSDGVTDEHPLVLSLCKTLESLLRHGLIRESRENSDFFDVVLSLQEQQNTFGRPKGCLCVLPLLICKAISFVCEAKPVRTNKGRGRLLLRSALKGQWLITLIDILNNWVDITGHYSDDSLLRSSTEMVLKLLHNLKVKFQIDLENFAFLDKMWERPIYRKYELVPCKDLGLMVCSIEGHIIVTKVKPYSVAGEDEKVEPGDFVIAIDNVILFDLSPEFIAKMIKKLAGKVPIKISVAKAKGPKAKVYPAFEQYLRWAGMDVDSMEKKWQQLEKWSQWRHGRSYSCPTNDLLTELIEEQEREEEDEESNSSHEDVFSDSKDIIDLHMAQSGYHLTYLGSLQVGKVGDTSFLDWAIRKVMNDPAKIEHEISFHLLELGIRMYSRVTSKLVLSYPYPKISACGCNSTDSRYVAFIGGDNLCRLAQNFMCHVFYAEDSQTAKEIVSHMATGFERTMTTA